ncbi:MAG TPA: hypothetical protein VMH04_19510 [Candidatus Solibacter sp.]|nr:hypothetical protein [Candidatus Solibacter sp.]
MLPSELKAEQFGAYPPQAKALVTQNLSVLRELPLSFLPGLLREAIEYDYKFPAERKALERELATLARLTPPERGQWLREFANIALSPKLERFDWVNLPAQFVEQLSSHLWTTHQLDAFRLAATAYADRLHAAAPPEIPAIPRIGITVFGQGTASYDKPLFRKLRPQGAYFSRVSPENGMRVLLDAVTARAQKHPQEYAHWYIDGGNALEHDLNLTCVAYGVLEPVRANLLRNINLEIEKPGMGPEMLRTIMAGWRPADLGMKSDGDAVLDRFQVRLLTEGSGTQIFSTSFTQWAAREALRRAEPATLLVRFAPRQRLKPMNELLAPDAARPELDAQGSLVDAEMAAYYDWLNQQRLPGAEKAAFLAWYEGHSSAVVIGPSVPRGTESNEPTDMKQLLSWIL